MKHEENIIELRDAVAYQQETLVLNNINFSVAFGEFVYLVGKTGSGKSSLLKVLYGDLVLAGGKGTVAGFDLKTVNWKTVPQLRRKIGIVFQDFQLLTDRNVEANLHFVLHATGWKDKVEMKSRIDEVLALVGLQTKGFKMPHQLSGGEQQRVVVARALLNHPELILADEPTGNLDPDTSQEILQLLMQINREKKTAVLFASHDLMTIHKFPARTIRCENGKLFEENINAQTEIIKPTIDVPKTDIEFHEVKKEISEMNNELPPVNRNISEVIKGMMKDESVVDERKVNFPFE